MSIMREIVVGIYIFLKDTLLVGSDSACGSCGIQGVSHGIGRSIEFLIICRFVDSYSPYNYGRMIPVAQNHISYIGYCLFLPGFITDMLPAGYLCKNEKSQSVARIYEVLRLRIVRGSDCIDSKLIFKN